MTLKEFLSLSDVKDGIATQNRIEELIALMQKEKCGEEISAGEATRQHSAIARAITETKDTNCLNHFIKLGGLCYINGWLKDGLKSADDTNGDIIEDSVTLHFKALEKLGISNEMLISSGILDTVKNLCDHNNTIIKYNARKLLDNWKDADLTLVAKNLGNVDPVGVNEEDKAMPKSDEDGSLLKVIDAGPEQADASGNITEAGQESGLDCLQLVEAEHVQTKATCSQISAPVLSDQIKLNEEATGASISTDAASISIPEVVTPREGIINIGDSNSLHARDNIGGTKPLAHETTNNGQVNEKINITSADLKITEVIQSSTPKKQDDCSSVPDILMAEVPEPGTQVNIDCKESLVPTRDDLVDDGKEVHFENSSGMNDLGHQISSLQGSPERTSPTQDALPENAAPDIVVGLNSRSDEDFSKVSAIQNLARDTKISTVAETRSDMDMDYGIMDALEVARQVAKAVEMDMVNDGSDENISDASREPGSPDSTNEINSQSRNLSEESPSKVDSSPQLSTENKIESSSSEKLHSEPEEGVDQPQPLVQEVQVNTNKETCEFDLNQEVPFENAEFSVNLNQDMDEANGALPIQNSSPIPEHVASVSISHDVLPLNRSHGRRGSVGTSACHQLPPHIYADPYVLSSSGGQQKQRAFSIDLNLDREGNVSNDASAPAKSKEFEFDLNMMSDVDDDPPSSSWRHDKHNISHLNGHPSSSHASSLFPMQHTKNIDLNEGPVMHSIASRPQPFFVSMPSSQNVDVHPFFGVSSSQNLSVRQEAKPVISIMGARVEVNGNDYFHGAPSLSNGKSENSVESNLGAMGSYLGIGPTGSYGQTSQSAYYNTNAGPTMSFLSPVFRPGNTMTYMVDPRVGPLPQIVNSPSVVPHMYPQSPFFLSMAGTPPGLSGVSPSRPNFDLNLGFMNEGGNRPDMASRQLFGNNQGRFIGEHLIPTDSRASSSLGKRKESETGWETYPYNMKHRYPPGNG